MYKNKNGGTIPNQKWILENQRWSLTVNSVREMDIHNDSARDTKNVSNVLVHTLHEIDKRAMILLQKVFNCGEAHPTSYRSCEIAKQIQKLREKAKGLQGLSLFISMCTQHII